MRRLRYLRTLLAHLWGFALENKVWWMVPLVIVLGLLGLAILFAQVSAPFIYPLW